MRDLKWEKDFDCNLKFKQWIIENNLGTDENLKKLKNHVKILSKNRNSEHGNPIKNRLKI